jgi:A/G-specific adenine glycosylase
MKRLTEFDDLPDPTFSQAVIDWQRAHGRHALPWQNTRDAYRVWLSEIMLQQTQVAAVLGYYARFLERFPTVQDLAGAPIEDVMACWSGLGYYTRARNLHACAVRVVQEYGGQFPADPALLADLPGIGRSTSAFAARKLRRTFETIESKKRSSRVLRLLMSRVAVPNCLTYSASTASISSR